MKIDLLRNSQIDKYRWDKTLKASYNSMVYGFSWYLDIVAPGWSALVSKNYQFIMPVPFKRKIFFKIALQPYFAQQLGIFSTKKITQDIINLFFERLSASFSYVELNMNKVMITEGLPYTFRKNVTFELDLIQPYEGLKQQYNDNTKRNLKKCEKNNIYISEQFSQKQFLNFFKENIDNQLGLLEKKDYKKIAKIIKLHKFPLFSSLIIFAQVNGTVCAAAFFIKTPDRIFYMFGVSNKLGKETLAMFQIIDYVIRKFSKKNMILDFEGSNIENIARMYKGFGAKPSSYDTLIINHLPFLFLK
ncbi:MAG TPA: hypothetical protein EYP69_04360 [Bacteroidales bacterium]|nr:hypothetical protein [Bacteroidales bacterium]